MSNLGESPRYIFLMRHAAHIGGHLTDAGSNHVRELAARLADWIRAEWRDDWDRVGHTRTVRLWYTTQATEVQETVDLLTREVLAEMQRQAAPANYPFAFPVGPEDAAGARRSRGHGQKGSRGRRMKRSQGHRQPWMAAQLPSAVTRGRDVGQALSAYSPDTATFKGLCDWLNTTRPGETEARRTETDVPLLVGNDPLISWLAANLTGRPIPVARGELICLAQRSRTGRRVRMGRRDAGGGRWRLLWTLSEDGEVEAEAIRAKIKSKMNTAAAFGTVVVGLTTFLLQNALQAQPSIWQWLAFAGLGTSAALYFATLFLYDTLQMPSRFWGSRWPAGTQTRRVRRSVRTRLRHGRSTVQRPPSSTARVLQTSMVRIWTWIFKPATVLAGVGIALFAFGATSTARDVVRDVQAWHFLVAIAALVTAVVTWVAWHRPDIGTSD